SALSSAPEYDPDAEFVYDYQTLRIGGLTFVAVIMILSVLLLASNKIRRCGKPRVSVLISNNGIQRR
uniref:FXYD domain-containing ion transport regulator n=1 Tax=Hucho hucho TaxID=62062 RepID=A0A4W5L7R9_9TELE